VMSDVSEYTILHIENGHQKSYGEFRTVEKLFHALGYELDAHLIDGDGEKRD
jgi:hypothetical protein